jgi:hypothetical protein
LEDDLKKYHVDIPDKLPIWYYETIEVFIINYCPDMIPENKLLLLHLIDKVKPKPKKDNVVRLRKTA